MRGPGYVRFLLIALFLINPFAAASMAGLSTSGTLTHWFRDVAARELAPDGAFGKLAREAEASPPGAGGLVMLPYYSGERTPIHDPAAKGVIFGLNLTHRRGDIYRALLEGIACGTNHIIETYREIGIRAPSMPWVEERRTACGRRRPPIFPACRRPSARRRSVPPTVTPSLLRSPWAT